MPQERAGSFFENKAAIELGKRFGNGFEYSVYKGDVNTECGLKQDYMVSFSYSNAYQVEWQTHDQDQVQPGTYEECRDYLGVQM